VSRRAARATLTALLVLLLAASSAEATPTVTFNATPLPIPGFQGTGYSAGAGAALELEFGIAGHEYGGFPPPLIGVTLRLPRGMTLDSAGFPTCLRETLEPDGSGPRGCPRGSAAGPVGQSDGYVAFGTELVPEITTTQAFYAPGGGLTFFTFGHSPVLLEVISPVRLLTASGGEYGDQIEITDPLVETVPGAPDASTTSVDVTIGSALLRGGQPQYFMRMPESCPLGYLPYKAEFTFAGLSGLTETTVTKTFSGPCPVEASEPPPVSVPGTEGAVTAPADTRCLSRRRFTIHVLHIAHLLYRLVTVELNGKPVNVLRGRREHATIDLRGLPKGTYRARIAVVTSTGRVLSGTRTYHTCEGTPLRPKRPPKL
jgi:hypothetical protein